MSESDDLAAFCSKFGFSVRETTYSTWDSGAGLYRRRRAAGLEVVDGSGCAVKVMTQSGARHAALGMKSLDAFPLRSFHRGPDGRTELWENLRKGHGIVWKSPPVVRGGRVWTKTSNERAMAFSGFSSWAELDLKLQASGAYDEAGVC